MYYGDIISVTAYYDYIISVTVYYDNVISQPLPTPALASRRLAVQNKF